MAKKHYYEIFHTPEYLADLEAIKAHTAAQNTRIMKGFEVKPYVVMQGDLVQVSKGRGVGQPQRGGGKRGKITGFSGQARARLLRLFSSLNTVSVRTVFVTLTFHHEKDWDKAKAALRRFLERVRRRSPRASAVWRRERQGNGNFHFHIIFFRLPYISQEKLQKIWTECTKEDMSIVDIRLLRSKRAAFNYVSKYVAKDEKRSAESAEPSLDNVTYLHAGSDEGKHYGIFNRKNLPFAEIQFLYDVDKTLQDYAQWYMSKRGKRPYDGSWSARTMIMFDAGAFFWHFVTQSGGIYDRTDTKRFMLSEKVLSPSFLEKFR